ncbi:DNA-binding transcriptional LysR family regulator [Natronocella acetinitrilica]|uniref:DNA-binding transcriptional LysR family regulator n=1 Tax=Natronocella acetinitrilica TaxID=414046 RepID=A0AAE3G9R6_9GAMM|nr:LysR substrate-binding domain-containing protein [Natronocella acetinitrilica]MCP1677128.1 DNA-binding transcriptional LysR family regulator [Natronocella acetinitrilica]
MNQTAQPDPVPQPLPLLETDVLRTFVAIAECGSFTRAARQVFRTPSALSMQIKRLEETLGQPLFLREPRLVRLTAEGEALLGYARRLLKLNEEAVTQFLAPPLAGTVRFGTPDDVGTRVLPGVLARFARSHPAAQVNVSVGGTLDIIRRLDLDELDLALVTGGNDGQDQGRGEVVDTESLVWAGREGGIAARRTPLPLALASQGCAWRTKALAALDAAGVGYRVAYSSENCAGQEAAMIADLAVAPFPLSLIRPPLRRLGPDTGLPPLGDYQVLLVRNPKRSPVADALAEYVIEELRLARGG